MTAPAHDPQPDPLSSIFEDADGYIRSPEDAAMYAMTASSGRGYTTPAREARRMLTGSDPRYKAMGQNWLAIRNLPETGDAEPLGWQDWQRDWLNQHPGEPALIVIGMLLPDAPPEQRPLAPPPQSGAPVQRPLAPPPQSGAPVQPAEAQVTSMTIRPAAGSHLERLFTEREETKARLADMKARLEDIGKRIESEITSAYPGVSDFDIPGHPAGLWPALHLYWYTSRRCDVTRLKNRRPDVYEEFLVQTTGRWALGTRRGNFE